MGAYDKKEFSKQYSIRTEANLEYIRKTVNKNEEIKNANNKFLDGYETITKSVETLVDEIRKEAKDIVNVQKKGKNILSGKMYNIARALEETKKELERNLAEIESTGDMNGDELYEVTQLLNSLMGIAVLPYEMHKEYFKSVDEEKLAAENQGKSLKEIQDILRKTRQYKALDSYIKELYVQKKWYSTYRSDLQNNVINENGIVFSFLAHLRNSTCHSGDNAMSILPLSEGQRIEEILFYDHYEYRGVNQEFAMLLSVNELEKVVELVTDFYRDTDIGTSDKTKQMENAEERVRKLLTRS